MAGLSISLLLAGGAAAGWWWSVRMAADMRSMSTGGGMSDMDAAASVSMSLVAFAVGWVAMMAAMMFPAISPMVKAYSRSAAKGNVAPVPFFVAGYLLVWTAICVPAYVAWRALDTPLAEGAEWTGRLAGLVFLLAATYQVTPLKTACLQRCRSPISFFIRHGGTSISTPYRAARLGGHHGLFCLGCCWAIMVILVALGTMNLAWMGALTVVIFLERVAPRGELLATAVAAGFGFAGIWLLADPSQIATIT